MPELARFYGMVVKMYFLSKEHNPPHIHVIYNDCMGVINIETLEIIEGDLPAKAEMLAKEWTAMHQQELITMWQTQEFRKLPPLI